MTEQTSKISAVILAGETKQDLLPDPNITNRAMIPLAGKNVLQWVVDALGDSGVVERIVAVGNVRAEGLTDVIEPAGNFLSNMMIGLDAIGGVALVVTSDIPLLTGEAVADFVVRAREEGADLAIPIIARSLCESRYPDLRRTYARLREGEFTLGNVALVNAEFMRRNRVAVEMAYAARKSPLRLAGMIGAGLILRLLLAQIGFPRVLPLARIEGAASHLLGGHVKGIPSEYPEIGEDMDRPGDLEIMQRIFEEKSGARLIPPSIG